MGLTMAPSASTKEVLVQLAELAEHLQGQRSAMKALEKRLERCVNVGIMARMPYAKMVAIFEDVGLGDEEVLVLESILGEGDIFRRTADVPARKLDDDFGKRGGEQTLVLPHLPKRRVTATDINDYHHPEEFYKLPSEIKTMQDHWSVMKLLFQEAQRFAGDTYATAAERKCVTSRHRLRAIGVGDPKPYGNKKRTWDSCYVKYITKARADYRTWGLSPSIDPDPEQLAPGRPPTGLEPDNYWDESEDSDSEVDLEEERTSSNMASSSKSSASSKRLMPSAHMKRKAGSSMSHSSDGSTPKQRTTKGKTIHINRLHSQHGDSSSSLQSSDEARRLRQEQALQDSALAAKAVGMGQSRVETALTNEEEVAARTEAARDAYHAAKQMKEAKNSAGKKQKAPTLNPSKDVAAKQQGPAPTKKRLGAGPSSPSAARKKKKGKNEEQESSDASPLPVARRPGTRSSPMPSEPDSRAPTVVSEQQSDESEEEAEMNEVPSSWKPARGVKPLEYGATVGREVLVKQHVWPKTKITKGALGWSTIIKGERKGKKKEKGRTVTIPEIKVFDWWFPLSSPDIVPMSN